MISIVAAVFLFNAVLIDFARIQAAKRQTDMAVDAAVRSALAAFDKELQGKYGLFGVSKEQVEPLFREIIEQNLTHPAGDGSFSLIDPQLSADSAHLEATGDLGNHVVFEQQVLEDMKYKAPIEITLEMFDKFKQLAAVMKTASAATKASKAMRKSYDSREKSLDSFWESRKALDQANLAIPSLIDKNGGSFDLTDSNRLFGQIADVETIASHYDMVERYYLDIQKWEKQKAELEQRQQAVRNQIQSIQQQISQMTASAGEGEAVDTSAQERQIDALSDQLVEMNNEWIKLDTSIRDTLGPLNVYLSQAHSALQQLGQKLDAVIGLYPNTEKQLADAKEANQKMKEALDKAKQETGASNYENVSNAPNADGAATPQNGDLSQEQASLEKLIKDMESLILPESYFERMEQDLQAEKSKLTAVKNSVDQLTSALPTAYQSSRQPPTVVTVKGLAQDIYLNHSAAGAQIYKNSLPENYPEEAKRREEKAKYEQNKESPLVTQQEEKANLGIKDVFNILNAFKTLKAENEDYQKLDTYYQKYMQQQVDDADKGQIEPSDDYEDASSQAMSAMDLLFAGLGDFFESMRNEMYVNEYAFEHFNSFDPAASSNYFKDGKVDANELAKALGADNSGIEYLIYGFHKPGANVGAALGELFLIRVAIGVVEGLTKPQFRSLGHPLLILIAAIAYGVGQALQDMIGFFAGKEVPLAGIQPLNTIKLKYKDYLRLFLLIHSAETKKLARMQALIQLDTDKDLSQYFSYLSGNAQFSVRLWFLPEIMKSLSRSLFTDQEVKGNRFYYNNGSQEMSY
ncbi:hypothetical protein B5M42_016330 [Paenibacillus athensensis]|nr:hypothetical protein [Paenibacillus athensensis]MCD1260381.1 hypothetical protein [Paenibacillus athensensis]